MKIIKQSEHVTEVEYSHLYRWRNDPGAGFSFSCDEDGKLHKMTKHARKNYKKCQNGEYDVVYLGIQQWERSWINPSVGLCECGTEVILDSFTNTCERCGRDYNQSGTLLAPREQWGEETGEHWTDVVLGNRMGGNW